jgi:hypothetical protein
MENVWLCVSRCFVSDNPVDMNDFCSTIPTGHIIASGKTFSVPMGKATAKPLVISSITVL